MLTASDIDCDPERLLSLDSLAGFLHQQQFSFDAMRFSQIEIIAASTLDYLQDVVHGGQTLVGPSRLSLCQGERAVKPRIENPSVHHPQRT